MSAYPVPLAVPPNSNRSWRLPSIAVAAWAGVIVSILHNVVSKYRFGTLLIDPYWIGFYVTSYGDHYRRRALIGTLCRLVAPHGISVLAINIVAIVVLCSLIFLLIKAWQHLEVDNTFRGRLFTFAFFAAPFIGLLWEVLGDTLADSIPSICCCPYSGARSNREPSNSCCSGSCLDLPCILHS